MKLNSRLEDLALQDNCFFAVQDLSEVVDILGKDLGSEGCESLRKLFSRDYSDLFQVN